MGVNGRPMRACALSMPSETPRCSDQLNESSAAHATVEVAIAVLFKASFIDFLHHFLPRLETVRRRCEGDVAPDQNRLG
jgi:hypothetical protein